MSFEAPAAQPVTPAMPAAPPPVLAPQGAKPRQKSQNRTFLGTDSTPGGMASPAANTGGKTLLGA